MLAEAGGPLGLEFTFVDPAESPCAAGLGRHIRAEFADDEALQQLSSVSDVVTYEFENVAVDQLESLARRVRVLPDPAALRIAQRRDREKQFFERIGIPVSPWACIDSQTQLEAALNELQFPVIVKTNRFGYDGKGQQTIRSHDEAIGLFSALGNVTLTLEQYVDFDCEVSIIGTRAADGNLAVYPLTRNEHANGILRNSRALPVEHPLAISATAQLRTLTEALDYVGTVAIEFFVSGDRLIGNEFAPRVHNSGHWTIEGAAVSQFENHLRAICGLPLGSTEVLVKAAMQNFIGEIPHLQALLSVDGLHLHDYRKEPRPGRKVGHATIVADRDETLEARLRKLTDAMVSM